MKPDCSLLELREGEVGAVVLALVDPVILDVGIVAVKPVVHVLTLHLVHVTHYVLMLHRGRVHLHRPVGLFPIIVLPHLLEGAQEGVLLDLSLLVLVTYCPLYPRMLSFPCQSRIRTTCAWLLLSNISLPL